MTQAWDVLVYVVLPLWVLAGFGDYLCHRFGDMEHANGVKENLIHLLMLTEVGMPLLAAVFFRINALLLGLMILCLIAHEITSWFDLKLAMTSRKVSAIEHQIHSLLDVLPFTAFLLICILHWPQMLALFGQGHEAADFSLGPKQIPRWGEIIPPFAAFLVFIILPYGEETLRGLAVHRAVRRPDPSP